jgi:hypothetical protein
MKKRFVTLVLVLLVVGNIYSQPKVEFVKSPYEQIFPNVLREQIRFDANNIDTWIQNTGIFDLDIRTNNTPGMMWPKGSGRFAGFTAGLTIAAYIEGQLKTAAASYAGEYAQGYVQLIGGVPTPMTNTDFKLYKVMSTDSTSADYLNWYKMIPYGAPYVDRNNNGQWDPGIDRPGIKNATQTIFVCMTDGFPETHTSSEGFGGGTLPIFAEIHLTAWAYMKGDSLTAEPLNDVQYFSYEIINKNTKAWNNTYMGIVTDIDLGDATDDYIGCDTVLNLAYCFNGDNMDGYGSGNPPFYGVNPPASGMNYMLSPVVPTGNQNDTVVYYNPPGSNNRIVKRGFKELGMTSFIYFLGTGSGDIVCVQDPATPLNAYRYLSGIKKDGSSWFHPFTKQRVKKLYTGNPETGEGWTEFGYNGNVIMAKIQNCLGGDTVTTFMSPPGDRRHSMNTGRDDFTVNPGDTQRIIIAQMVARGTNNKNSVTKLKDLCRAAKLVYESNFTVSVRNISSEVPSSYSLSQNYPNPFNPVTKIKFAVPKSGDVKIIVYDIMGREVQILVNEKLQPGVYETTFDGSTISSGVYFYKLSDSEFSETKRMLLIK